MSNRASIFCSFALTAAAATGAASQAKAADLGSFFGGQQDDQQADAPTQPVEFGTGWYIRGSVGGAVQDTANLLSDPASVSFLHQLNWSAELGAGYQFNQWFRTDATYTYYGSQPMGGSTAGNCAVALDPYSRYVGNVAQVPPIGIIPEYDSCSYNEHTSLQKNLFLANGYVDLGNYWGVTPYIGGGVGTAYLNAQQSLNVIDNTHGGVPYAATLTFPDPSPVPLVYYNKQGVRLNPQPTFTPGGQHPNYSTSSSKWNFAFALMAGFSYDISQNLKLDIGYRYANFGSISFRSLSDSLFNKNLSSQEVRLGIRYIVD